jgi:sulfotransferase
MKTQKTLHLVAGLPRSGSTMMINLLKQNPSVDGAAVSSLHPIISNICQNWDNLESNREYPNEKTKINVLKGIIDAYHSTSSKDIVFDKDRMWVTKISLLEALLEREIKILCPVRNPAEILSSFEKIRRNNPTKIIASDSGGISTIASRCMYYSGPDGILGLSHASIKDAITSGYLDRLLFVDYNKFCNTPKTELKRIYDFFELPNFKHDFEKIEQKEIYNDLATGHPNLHKIKPRLEKTTVNCVDYLGLDLYEQYNSQIFWDAWI